MRDKYRHNILINLLDHKYIGGSPFRGDLFFLLLHRATHLFNSFHLSARALLYVSKNTIKEINEIGEESDMTMPRKVVIIESYKVVPHDETPKHRLSLSNLDVFAPMAHVSIVYLYKPNGDPDFFSMEILKNALSKVLVTFYPLAGRLVFDRDGCS